ncbi:hypothetical protein BDE02_17G095200 [Populus trichocarpa]|nr:hypothetical protein BDE02_17G095200 [Populus trichocarpa]
MYDHNLFNPTTFINRAPGYLVLLHTNTSFSSSSFEYFSCKSVKEDEDEENKKIRREE